MHMNRATTKQPLDFEFLVLAPPFVFLLCVRVYELAQSWEWGEFGNAAMLHDALVTAFYALLVVLLVVRRPARMTSRSWVANTAAFLGTFFPFLLILNTGKGAIQGPLTVASMGLMIGGMACSIYALAVLGRSFGVIPAARSLVRHGPYRVIRHPLYVGELIGFAGVVLAQLTLFSIMVFVAALTIQAYRAVQEEGVLLRAFPEYEEYSQDTARFIPGLL